GSVTGGLYLFDLDKIGKSASSNSVFVCHVSSKLWHCRLGHPADQVLSILGKKLVFSKIDHQSPCDICHKARQTREPFPLCDHKSKSVGDIAHCDVWGPYRVISKDGFKFFLTIVDYYSRAVWVYLLKSKTEVGEYIESFIKLVFTQFGKKVKIVRSDNETEFVNHHLSNFFKDLGIIHQNSCAYTPQQNGVAERKHRHLLNVARSLMFQGGIPLSMWPECILTAIYPINRLPSSVLSGVSPYVLVYGLKSRSCLVLAGSYWLDISIVGVMLDFWVLILLCVVGGTSIEDGNSRIASDDCSAVEDEVARDATYIEENVTSEGNVLVNQNGEGQSSPMWVSPELRRSTRPKVMPARFNDFVVNSSVRYGLEKYVYYNKLSKRNLCFYTTLNKTTEPKTFQEASQNPKWIEAMNIEMEALFRNNTYVLVDLPPGRKAIGCKWLWKIKYKSSGEVERYKARLVSKGFSQRYGIDYEETFSLVVKMVTIRCLIALSVQNSWPLYQLDANNAFLYGDLKEDVYMELPPGYYDKDETRVCKLIKSLYGLKQAPRQWNEKLTTTLIEHGFVQSKNDYSLFIKDKNGVFIAILVYVDDIVVTGNNNSEIDKFKHFLSTKFMIKDLGQLKYFLGIEVLENMNGLCLNQTKYCLELLNEYGLLACKPTTTPLQQNVVLGYEESENDKFFPSMTKYQKIVGKLIYLSITRPDISYDVHYLTQHMHAPLQSHFSAALRVLRYLKGAPGTEIQFHKENSFSLHAFSEADRAKCPKTRKSVSGYCLYLCNNLVYWKSKKQATISRSSAESEYRCLASTTCEIIWVVKIRKDLGVEGLLPVNLYCDSNGVVKVLKVASASNVADVFTKGLSISQHNEFCSKLNLVNMFKP
ncbi:ribonuclease H-like domain-containing protein, partial [Tanacetum coccineum]